ncbi:MAG: cytochrome c554 family protein [Thermodesulfovibrionia bacterium]|nr:cytochrome c554 family protein [Thermodesulfovibrionia bacterium]
MKIAVFVFIAFFTVSFASASEKEGKILFERMCDKCHSLERALSMSKDLGAWERTTMRMSNHSGGIITDVDALKISEYLASREQVGGQTVSEKEEEKEIKKLSEMEEHEIFDFKKVRVSQFIEPSMCGECHSEIYEQWNGSMHSKAFTDPLWRAATKLFFREAVKSEEILELKACVKCHTPLGFRSYSITSPGDEYDKLAELPAQGIFCNWCHNISEVKHIGDAGYEVEPGGGEDDPSTMLGPRKDADSDFHPTQYSELHTKSEFCGLCHNVSHAANKLPFEQTYDEWKNSPYNTGDPETTVNCQDCHMRQRPGIPSTGKTERPDNPGMACDGGPEREHVWTHYFVGANAIITKLLGSEVHAQMAVERLQNAADLELMKSNAYRKNELSFIKVKVINSGAGHYLPTGLTEVRQMWLDVNITDAQGKTILRSGNLKEDGEIADNTVIYNTHLGNEKGEKVINVAKADRILSDHRIPPKGYAIETYVFYIPADAVSPLTVEVSLKYRSASQVLANTLLGDNAPEIPVIEMVGVVDKLLF